MPVRSNYGARGPRLVGQDEGACARFRLATLFIGSVGGSYSSETREHSAQRAAPVLRFCTTHALHYTAVLFEHSREACARHGVAWRDKRTHSSKQGPGRTECSSQLAAPRLRLGAASCSSIEDSAASAALRPRSQQQPQRQFRFSSAVPLARGRRRRPAGAAAFERPRFV